MPSFKEIAEPLAKLGVPMTPVRPGTKKAFLPDFPTTATTDLNQITAWDAQYPGCNGACVARAEDGGVWFWEVDSADVLPRIQKDTGHDVLTEIDTFRVRSRPGRGHFYFRHNASSVGLGNISQTYVVGQDWSVRTHREYVVAPGSIHPDTQQPYQALNWNSPIAEAPQWLIDWVLSQKIQKHSAPQGVGDAPRNENGRVPHGSIHGYMLTQAGKLRQLGMSQESIETALLQLVHDNCEAPIDDNKVRQMAKSICIYPPGENKTLVMSQQVAAVEVPEPEEEIDFSESEYPVFPRWVMHGTSLYEGFVKPYCEQNSRIDYFMWVPTAAMMMNYLGTKVKVPFKGWKPSFYLVLIGEKGNAHKSSSIKDGMKFLEYASVLSMYSKEVKNADGKILVWEAGSPEGLGTDMQRTNCKNAVLFYDELSALVAKARIEGSGMSGALLKMYESNNFSNSIKSKKDAFSITPDSYCATLITATTDQRFIELWAQLAGDDTGLKDRFTFVLQPEEMPDSKLEAVVSFHEAALSTRKLIDKAVGQGSYQFFDQTPFNIFLKEHKKEGRTEIRAEKWALYFAIDLGLSEIDEDCVERGIAMAKYELAVKSYLRTYEAKNDEANIQNGIMILLKKHRGVMKIRDIERKLSSHRYGISLWRKALYNLMLAGYIVEEGQGISGNPKVIRMLRDMKIGE